MATARKLPSGSWRCQVYDHAETVYLPDGGTKTKRVYKSFTASTKRECEHLAALWAMTREDSAENINVGEVLNRYICTGDTSRYVSRNSKIIFRIKYFFSFRHIRTRVETVLFFL